MLKPNDVIYAVNGKSVMDLKHMGVIGIIKQAAQNRPFEMTFWSAEAANKQ